MSHQVSVAGCNTPVSCHLLPPSLFILISFLHPVSHRCLCSLFDHVQYVFFFFLSLSRPVFCLSLFLCLAFCEEVTKVSFILHQPGATCKSAFGSFALNNSWQRQVYVDSNRANNVLHIQNNHLCWGVFLFNITLFEVKFLHFDMG